ncbi:DUF5047 domain-containing protein [Streptomyces sp. T-3]|nr:DUF5047 domain-containing protein [Streptomyces sp. T-3]
MRKVSAAFRAALANSHEVITYAWALFGDKSWFLPLNAAEMTFDASAANQRRCTLTLPRISDGYDWDPTGDPAHPLSPYGQYLNIQTGIRLPNGTVETVSMGHCRINGVDVEGDTVTVSGADLWDKLAECRIPTRYGSFKSSMKRQDAVEALCWAYLKRIDPSRDKRLGLPKFHASLGNPALRAAMILDEQSERKEHLDNIARAWGAQYAMDDTSSLYFEPFIEAPKATPDLTMTGSRPDSTVTGRGTTVERERLYNVSSAQGLEPDTGEILYDEGWVWAGGPLGYQGEYGVVPRWYASTMIKSKDEASNVARQLLYKGARYSRTETITAVPDPSIELNDTVRVDVPGERSITGLVTSIRYPLTPGQGEMTLTLSESVTATLRHTTDPARTAPPPRTRDDAHPRPASLEYGPEQPPRPLRIGAVSHGNHGDDRP